MQIVVLLDAVRSNTTTSIFASFCKIPEAYGAINMYRRLDARLTGPISHAFFCGGLSAAEGEAREMLLLEEKAYRALSEGKRELYVLQWLQNLPQAIRGTPRVRERLCSWWLARVAGGREI